jgi:hypothetical protein
VNLPAAKAWSIWEGATSKLIPDPDFIASYGDEAYLVIVPDAGHSAYESGFPGLW